jgi:dihydroorotate dehydrogenase
MKSIDKPVIYSGGVRSIEDIIKLIDYGVDAVAISTLFSLHQVTGTPLISYIDEEIKERLNKIK